MQDVTTLSGGSETRTTPATRSGGILDDDARRRYREQGVELAFDPVQQGWVRADCADDITPEAATAPARPGRVIESTLFRTAFRLRPWAETDAETLAALLDAPEVWAHLPETYPDPMTVDIARDLIAIGNATDHQEVRAIEVDGTCVGQVRLLFPMSDTDRREAEISYWLGTAHWGKGIASGVVASHTAESFLRHRGLETVFARVHPDNEASARVLAKANYTEAPERDAEGWRIFRVARGDV